jgi:hypothetical protein
VDPERLYTFDEIAELAGGAVDHRRVRRWTDERKLGFITLPGGRGRRVMGKQWLKHLDDATTDPE